MLTLGNIVLLSQLHPEWDWDQTLEPQTFHPLGWSSVCLFVGAQASPPLSSLVSTWSGGRV